MRCEMRVIFGELFTTPFGDFEKRSEFASFRRDHQSLSLASDRNALLMRLPTTGRERRRA